MTALITSLGLVLMLLATGPGSKLQRPLAVEVIGGLFTSILLTLVLLSTLYAWLEGHGAQDVRDTIFSEVSGLSARDKVVGYTPQVRVDILLEDGEVDVVLQRLRITDCGLAGRGIYSISRLIVP